MFWTITFVLIGLLSELETLSEIDEVAKIASCKKLKPEYLTKNPHMIGYVLLQFIYMIAVFIAMFWLWQAKVLVVLSLSKYLLGRKLYGNKTYIYVDVTLSIIILLTLMIWR